MPGSGSPAPHPRRAGAACPLGIPARRRVFVVNDEPLAR
jgi:hypothetical protein